MPFGTSHSMSVEEINHRALNTRLTLPPYFNNYTRNLVARMLERDPRYRITIAEMKEHPWFRNM